MKSWPPVNSGEGLTTGQGEASQETRCNDPMMLAQLVQRYCNIGSFVRFADRQTDRQTDRYFIDRKKVITDFFVIEMKEIYVHVYTRLLIC